MSSFFKSSKKSEKNGGSGKQKSSMSFRAKKYLASRATETSAGRSTIVKFFGTEGDNLLRALISAAEFVEGKPFAKRLL